jgi:hypothetical protein
MFNLKFVQRFLYLNWPPVHELENTWHMLSNTCTKVTRFLKITNIWWMTVFMKLDPTPLLAASSCPLPPSLLACILAYLTSLFVYSFCQLVLTEWRCEMSGWGGTSRELECPSSMLLLSITQMQLNHIIWYFFYCSPEPHGCHARCSSEKKTLCYILHSCLC